MLSKYKAIAMVGTLMLAGCKNVVVEIPVAEIGTVALTLQNPADQVAVEETAGGMKYTLKKNAIVTFTASGINGSEFEQWLFDECAEKNDPHCETTVTKNIVATAQFGVPLTHSVYLSAGENGSLHFPKLESASYHSVGAAGSTNLQRCGPGPNGEPCASFALPITVESVKLHVRAAPARGYVLSGWSSNCTPELFELFCEFDSSSADNIISATFRPVDGERLTLKQIPVADKEWALLYWSQITGLENEYADSLSYIPGLQYRPGALGSEYAPLGSFQGVEYFPQATFVGAYVREEADFGALALSNVTRLAMASGFDTFDNSLQGGKLDLSRLPTLPLLQELELTTYDTDYHQAGFVQDVQWPDLPNLRRLQIEAIVPSTSGNLFTFSNFQQYPSLETVALIGAISQDSINAVGDGGYRFVSISTDNTELNYASFQSGRWEFLDIWPKSLQTSVSLIESRDDSEVWTLTVGGALYEQLVSMFPGKASHLQAY